MNRLRRLLLITFLESFATVCVERGVYFLGHERLGFTDATNLWLALAFGAAYIAGAVVSHRCSIRLGEKRLLFAAIAGQLLVHAVLAGFCTPLLLFLGSAALGGLNGLKWPVLESYVSAGKTPGQTARAIGRFNISWAASVPLALAAAGPIISFFPRGLFLLPALINLLCLRLAFPLTARPVHLPQDHPDRPRAGQIAHYRALLAASRWTMLSSYASLWVLAALMPRIFENLGFSVRVATAMAGLVDVMRLAAFVTLERSQAWHNRASPLLLSIVVLPVGFFMILFGSSLQVVLAGEVLFGFAAGITYYAALYYAMVVENASVNAGGTHEGLIGLGFAIGPAAGLVGIALAPALGSGALGTIAGLGPLLAVCSAGALRSLLRARRARGRGDRAPACGWPPPR